MCATKSGSEVQSCIRVGVLEFSGLVAIVTGWRFLCHEIIRQHISWSTRPLCTV